MTLELQPILVAVGGLFMSFVLYSSRKRTPLPPGPRGLPLLGSVLSMPIEHQWIGLAEWSKRWGDIMSISVLGQQMIILNSYEHADALMNKRSFNTSNRPIFHMFGELIGWKDHVSLLRRIGDRSRRLRKGIHGLIGTNKNMSKHYGVILEETKDFMGNILTKLHDGGSTQVKPLIFRFLGSITLRLTYGYRVQDEDDPLVQLSNEVQSQFTIASQPGAFLVDVLPILKYVPEWVPGAGFKRKAKLWRKTMEKVVSLPVELVRKEMAAGTAKPSFVLDLLTDLDGDDPGPGRDDFAGWIGISLFTGGIDTASGTLYTFFLAMTLYPEVLKKAQIELDEQVGNTRLPNFDDRPKLPYINAIILEMHRWHTIVPLGLPHEVIEDDVYNGYLIPKGSMIMANQWQMLHDPEVYHDPHEFKPERFLGPNPEQDPSEIAFGFGRRACPGNVMADNILFISIAMILTVFDIGKVVRDGKVIEPEVKVSSGVVSHLLPFECKVTPRSEEAKSLIVIQ